MFLGNMFMKTKKSTHQLWSKLAAIMCAPTFVYSEAIQVENIETKRPRPPISSKAASVIKTIIQFNYHQPD